jgi:hypothetical protein
MQIAANGDPNASGPHQLNSHLDETQAFTHTFSPALEGIEAFINSPDAIDWVRKILPLHFQPSFLLWY